jgi:hypothetical protein
MIADTIEGQKTYERVESILFTGNSSREKRRIALDPGADVVVVKRPDASEIIWKVRAFLDNERLGEAGF